MRVYGPDAYPGPNQGQQTLYTEVFAGNAATPQANQYAVDYAPQHPANVSSATSPPSRRSPINIAFDYQANLAPNDLTQQVSASNPASPLLVKVDYQTRDLLDINLGVRVYDPNNVGPAQIVTVHNQVRIGNSNR